MSPLQRTSLPDQVAAILRNGIETSRWRRELPSEAELCREIQVSRVTLRKAIAQLVHERWITLGGRGHQHRIPRYPGKRVKPTGRTIRVLSPISPAGLGNVQNAALETLAERVTADGCRLEFEHRSDLFRRHQPGLLQQLDALPDTAGWILFYATEATQRWFAGRQRPCVVAGPLHEGVSLSCVYPDTSASAIHAAGRLYARGCRNLIYLTTSQTSLGVTRASVAFIEEALRLGAKARIVESRWEAPAVGEATRHLLSERPRPDGIFVPHSGHAITILCCLLAAGLRIPADIALIAGWDDVYLDYTIPSMARYRIDGVEFGRKIASALLDQLRHGPGKLRSVRILPELFPGETLSPV